MRNGWILIGLMVASSTAAAQDAPPDKPDTRPSGIAWRDRPSLIVGVFRVDVSAKLQGDFRTADQDLVHEGGLYETGSKRLGVEGQITDRVEFQIEHEFRRRNPWRDVFVNVRVVPALEVRAGKFKVPFSYEELTGVTKTDFAYRSLLAQIISPARDVGVMVHGRLLRRVLNYQVGVFRRDGENAGNREPVFLLPGEELPKASRSVAARLTAEPLRHVGGPRELRRLYVGAALTTSDVPEGLNSLRGQSLFGSEFSERMYVLGKRRRLGTEAIWMPGPFSVKSEWARATEQRKRQGLLDDDISDFVSSAWYLSGTWAITGEDKDGGVEPRKPIFQSGIGAVELGVRYEQIRFGSALKEGEAFANPRADPLLENAETLWTVGVNWYLNKWGKVVVNGTREAFQDPERTAVAGRSSNWAGVLRLQFVM
jgi:phosphate-selective porin OprO/OprP